MYTRVLSLTLISCAVGTMHAEDALRISGYGNMHYMAPSGMPTFLDANGDEKTDLNNGFFQLREFSLFLDYTVNDDVVISTELEAGENGTVYTANYAYVDITMPINEDAGELHFRAGKILVPFLSYNENKPNFKQSLMSQPFTAFGIAPVVGTPIVNSGIGWSDMGFMFSHTKETGDLGIFGAKMSLINGLQSDGQVLDGNDVIIDGTIMNPTIRPRDGMIQNEGASSVGDNNNNKAVVLKLTYTLNDYPLEMGLSLYDGAWDDAAQNNMSMYGLHFNWESDRWGLKGEYVVADIEQTAGILEQASQSAALNAMNTSTGDYQSLAWYFEGNYIIFAKIEIVI